MGQNPSAIVCFGYVVSDFEASDYSDDDNYIEIDDLGSDKLRIESCSYHNSDACIGIPDTWSSAYDWGEHNLKGVRVVTDGESLALLAEAKRLGLPSGVPRWVCICDYG